MLGGWRHHLITFKGEGLSLQAVVVIIFLLFLTGVVSFVRVPLVEGIQVILLNQGLERARQEGGFCSMQMNTPGTGCSKMTS